MSALIIPAVALLSLAGASAEEPPKPSPEKTVFHITGESEITYAVPVKILMAIDRTAGGRTSGVTGTITVSPAANDALGAAQAPVVGELFVEVSAFRSGIGKRDESVRRLLEAGKYPRIRFAITGVEPHDNIRTDSLSGGYLIKGTLEMRGVSKEVSFPVGITQKGAGLWIDGNFLMKLSDFGVTPPSLAMFVGRASDEVSLTVHLAAESIKPGLFASR